MDPPEGQEKGRDVSMEEEMNHDGKEKKERTRRRSWRRTRTTPPWRGRKARRQKTLVF